NQFLQTTANVISTGTTSLTNPVETLNLADASFDGLALGGETADGVAFFRGTINGTDYNYAGVFEDTDLGMPLTDTTGSAVWNGSFDHILSPSTDFTLHIAFDTNGGTLDAFVHAGQDALIYNHFIFDNARFDTRGFITGRVIYGRFLYNNPAATPTATRPATLRGLIGEQGAVGVFVGEVGQDIAGAFVAHPTAALDPNIINFADWAGAVGNPKATVLDSAGTGTVPLLNGAESVGNANSGGNFIQGLATRGQDVGFDVRITSFGAAFNSGEILLLAENSPSGVAFSRFDGRPNVHPVTGRQGRYYAGLLPGTTLGAPITDPNTSVIWDANVALAEVDEADPSSNRSFKMRVIFNGSAGTINTGTDSGVFVNGAINVRGDFTGTKSLNIEGRFGSDGLLYGTVDFANGNPGVLTGLIGVNGAVGAFVSKDSSSTVDYSGGFVAKPPE
ncbi:MAG: hypothetical protein K8953_07085, partial [Proteobacteria bacterium]|nr:hypothetical protein [Pseudomonadota bacterium]